MCETGKAQVRREQDKGAAVGQGARGELRPDCHGSVN